jgi:hypothetical protein
LKNKVFAKEWFEKWKLKQKWKLSLKVRSVWTISNNKRTIFDAISFKFNFVQEIIFLFPKNIISPFVHGSIELFFNLLLDHI